MIRLSQKGWNNVLIFTMLGMILLLNNVTDRLTDGDANGEQPNQLSLLPEHSLIMTIEFDQHKIERIGQSWRVTPAADIDGEQMQALVSAWQSVQLTPVDESPAQQPLVVVLWLAGESKGRAVQLFPDAQTPLLMFSGQAYRLLSPNVDTLLIADSR